MSGAVSRQLNIREAVPDDAAGLAAVLDELGYPAPAEVIGGRLARLAGVGPGTGVLVACAGDRIVGFLTTHVTPVLHRPADVGRITGLAVLRQAHGLGAGRALVAAAEARLAALGLTRIEVTSGPAHAPAHSFYRHLGYQDEGIRFARAVAPAARPA